MTRNGVYTRSPCFICGQSVSNAGLGYTSHMRKHVREGRAVEIRDYYDKYDFGYHYERAKESIKTTTEDN
jgi:hypothetical protein